VLWLLSRCLAVVLSMWLLCVRLSMHGGRWLRWRRPMLGVGLQNRIDLPPPIFWCVLLESFEGQKLRFGVHLFMTPMDMRLRN
jgi:hypothetical protein